MTKNDLYVEILQKLVDYLKLENIITAAERTEIYDYINLTQYDIAASKIDGLPSASQFHKIARHILSSLDDTTEISNTMPVRHHQASIDNKDRLMAFCYKCSTLAVMPIQNIKFEIANTTSQIISSTCGNILDLILLYYKDSETDLKYVWECCLGQHENDYFLITTEPDSSENNWRLYSYAYFCFVNEHRFERPALLNFNKETQFSSHIPYDPNNKYEQYFDAYNVMSESKYSDDVLSRYLRMYQMLEYMAFRRALADMTKGNIKENGFVRNVINKASKGSNSELEELKKGMNGILPDLSSIIDPTDITADIDAFIKDRLMIKNGNHDNARLWQVVYQLRNSIVHNKESELHFMYANTNVYKPGINLMKLLIEKLEPAIVDAINDSTKTLLEFSEQKIRVY